VLAATPSAFSFASDIVPDAGATGYWVFVGGTVAGCNTTNTGSPITLANVASRVSGVAPLAVFFDATGTTHGAASIRPFRDLEYQWNFGDTAVGSATWGHGSRAGVSKRGEATGPVTAHVYETPGTYIVKLTALDGVAANTVSNACVQIAVTDPNTVFSGTNTICIASGSLPVAGIGGCPAGAAVAQESNFAALVSTFALSGKRVLLRRGDIFTAATPGVIGGTGPGILGAYGTGANPQVRASANTVLLKPSTALTPGRADWRIVDLEFDGNGNASSIAIYPDGGIDQLTILRVYAQRVTNAFFFNTSILNYSNISRPGHTLWDQLAIVDSRTTNITGVSAALSIYASARRFMLLGNDLNNNGGGEHTVRLPSIVRGVISNNLLQGQPAAKHAFTLRAAVHGSAGVEEGLDTQYVVVSDNKFIGATGAAQTTMYGPQASTADERVADTITERNWYVAGGGANGTQVALQLLAHREQTIRNNLFDTSGGKAHGGIIVSKYGSIVPDQIRIYHNTFFSSDVDNDFLAVSIASANVTNVIVQNNLGYSPLDTQSWMMDCAGASSLGACAGLTASNNSTNLQVRNDPPGFTIPPLTTTDWKPTAGYAIGSGTAVPVWSDFFLVVPPAARDLGAVVH